jgi:hypothetical protein
MTISRFIPNLSIKKEFGKKPFSPPASMIMMMMMMMTMMTETGVSRPAFVPSTQAYS